MGLAAHAASILFVQSGQYAYLLGRVTSHYDPADPWTSGIPANMLPVVPMCDAKTLWDWYWSFVVGICAKVGEIIKDLNPRQYADCWGRLILLYI